MSSGAIPFIIAILIVAVFVFVAILLTGKHKYRFDIEAYQARFLAIENKLTRDNPATFMNAVIEGDKLLDRALNEIGVPGKTMGEKLKKAGDKFSNIDAVWHAHKLRNTVAHETDFDITYKQAATALLAYKQALKDLGAI